MTKHHVKTIQFGFFLEEIKDLYNPNRIFSLSHDDIKLFNPNTKTCPVFRSKKDAEITKKIYRVSPILVKEDDPNGNPWEVRFLSMFHMSNDSHLFKTKEELEKEGYVLDKFGNFAKDNERYLRLYEAKMIDIFDHRNADALPPSGGVYLRGDLEYISLNEKVNPNRLAIPRNYILEDEVLSKVGKKFNGIIGYKAISGNISNKSRTFVSTIIPWSGIGNSIIAIYIEKIENKTKQLQLLSNLSSFVFDYLVRQKVSDVNVNIFIVKQLPVLPPETYEKELLDTYFENPEIKTVGELIKEKVSRPPKSLDN